MIAAIQRRFLFLSPARRGAIFASTFDAFRYGTQMGQHIELERKEIN